MYTTLQDKLKRLNRFDILPLDMLHEIIDANPKWQYTKRASKTSQGLILQPVLHKVVKWEFDKWLELGTSSSVITYLEGKAILTFQDGSQGFLNIDESAFLKIYIMGRRYKDIYFRLLKPGKLAYVADLEISGVDSYDLVMNDHQSHQMEGLNLAEGVPVVVLQTLMLDDVPLVKFLHGEDIKWTYGALFDKDHFDEHDNDNHWI